MVVVGEVGCVRVRVRAVEEAWRVYRWVVEEVKEMVSRWGERSLLGWG